ncbi:hypothetical protein ACGFX2_33490 [Streptomyces goshikiensis]|uniref:hypothetical protein n=1 Tax=Streptomyces goshikiensis TaxID=1942 RepID=UPI0037167B58
MNVRKSVARMTATMGGAVLALSVLGGTAAYADMDLYGTEQSAHDAGAHSYRAGSDLNIAAIEDIRGDSHSVYTRYNRNYPSTQLYTKWEKDGYGHTAFSGTGGRIWDMKACISMQNNFDECSDWWTDNHGHG